VVLLAQGGKPIFQALRGLADPARLGPGVGRSTSSPTTDAKAGIAFILSAPRGEAQNEVCIDDVARVGSAPRSSGRFQDRPLSGRPSGKRSRSRSTGGVSKRLEDNSSVSADIRPHHLAHEQRERPSILARCDQRTHAIRRRATERLLDRSGGSYTTSRRLQPRSAGTRSESEQRKGWLGFRCSGGVCACDGLILVRDSRFGSEPSSPAARRRGRIFQSISRPGT
jgi:hypothetical protein